jgi:CheY-like chemotaxis protein
MTSPALPPAPPASAPRAGNLLVVDDDPAILDLLRECLRDDGYRVLAAADAEEALTMLSAFRFDLILTDALRVAAAFGGDPWAALSRLRAASGDTPLVILSAHTESSFDGYAERGFAGLVPKPFDIDALSAVIRRAIDRTRAASADTTQRRARA